MHPTDYVKSIDLDSPNLKAELTAAFPEHDVVVISGGGTPVAVIYQDQPEPADEIVDRGHESFLLDLLVCEAYYSVPQLSGDLVFPDLPDAENTAYSAPHDASAHTRREKPPDS